MQMEYILELKYSVSDVVTENLQCAVVKSSQHGSTMVAENVGTTHPDQPETYSL